MALIEGSIRLASILLYIFRSEFARKYPTACNCSAKKVHTELAPYKGGVQDGYTESNHFTWPTGA